MTIFHTCVRTDVSGIITSRDIWFIDNGLLLSDSLDDLLACETIGRPLVFMASSDGIISIIFSRLIGLSKERPILGHHAKAHILKSGGFHLKSGGFHVKSTQNLINQMFQQKLFSLGGAGRGL